MVRVSTGVAAAVLTAGVNNLFAISAPPVATPAALAPADQPFAFENVRWETVRIEKLRHAYYLLDHADGDYHGHRIEAMHAIKKAAEVLGVDIKGGGHAEEAQWESDRKLREARRILMELADQTGSHEQPHIHRAIKELDRALVIK